MGTTSKKKTQQTALPPQWNKHISDLVDLCKLYGVVGVSFKPGVQDEYAPDKRTIQINNRRSKENQFYILLHEYGHHMIMKNRSLQKKFATIAETDNPRSLSLSILSIEEEVMAWHFGEEAAKMHDYFINTRKFQLLKARCLKSHIASHKML